MSHQATAEEVLPPEFLSQPAPDIKTKRIEFGQTTLPEYDGLYAIILDNVLSPEECSQLLQAAEASNHGKWDRAMVNVGHGEQKLLEETRNCSRIIWDSRSVAGRVWKRIEHVPEVQEIVRLEKVPRIFGNGPAKRDEVWKVTRPNERMRFLKYEGGEYFRPHCDGSYETPDRKERTYFTIHLYLNNASSAEEVEAALEGGATTFHSLTGDEARDVNVLPRTGRILLFQHRDLLHSGADVLKGVKYTMRTDLLYALESTTSDTKSHMPVLFD